MQKYSNYSLRLVCLFLNSWKFHLAKRLSKYQTQIENNDNYCKFEREELANIVKSLLWDCYNNSILVIDERIQAYSKLKRSDATEVTNEDVFINSGVRITKSELNSDSLDLDLDKKIDNEITTHKPTFLLIHYGILERFYSNDKHKINKCLGHWVKEKKCIVIVTSGRGKHSLALPEYIRYLNLSSVLYAFVENQNKYSMNYIINQARR